MSTPYTESKCPKCGSELYNNGDCTSSTVRINSFHMPQGTTLCEAMYQSYLRGQQDRDKQWREAITSAKIGNVIFGQDLKQGDNLAILVADSFEGSRGNNGEPHSEYEGWTKFAIEPQESIQEQIEKSLIAHLLTNGPKDTQ